MLSSQSLNIPLVVLSASLLQVSLISPELHFSLDFPNTFSAVVPWQISFLFIVPPGNHFLNRRCEDKKWTFLSSAVDLGSKEFTVAAVKSSVHAAVAGDKGSAGSEAHPSFHLRWRPCFRMLCGFEVPHLQGGASVAWGEAVVIVERIISASRWSSLACYFVAHTFLVFQWIRKGLLQYYNASVCVYPCDCVGFYRCGVLQIRKEWLMPPCRLSPPEWFPTSTVTGIGRGREATKKLLCETICCKSSQRKIWNPPVPAMKIFRGPCPVSRSPRGCNSRSLELIGNIFAKLPRCDHWSLPA